MNKFMIVPFTTTLVLLMLASAIATSYAPNTQWKCSGSFQTLVLLCFPVAIISW